LGLLGGIVVAVVGTADQVIGAGVFDQVVQILIGSQAT
jgi:hypothetical protein